MTEPRLTVDTITSDQLDALHSDAERYRQDHLRACEQIAAMHEAAVGEVRGPIRGVVEDVIDVRRRAEQAEAAIARARELAADIGRAGWSQAAIARRILAALDEPKEPTTSACCVCDGTGTPIPDGGGNNEVARDRRGRLITHPPQPCPDCPPKEPTP